MTEPTASLPAGTRLAHYEVRSVLGAGGMGTVYLARDTALDREVAVKVLRPAGNRPSRRAILVRFLVKYPGVAWILVPPDMGFAQAGIWGLQGLAWAAGGIADFFADGRTLPDLLSKTRVVHRGPGEGARVP